MDDSLDSKPRKRKRKRKWKDPQSSAAGVKVKTLHINSLLLAANSPFFHQLFKNGVTDSKQRDVTLRISASNEAGVMELLNFMYNNTLKATTTPDVLPVLVAAAKFEASDCVRYCCEFLQKMPMSLESALLYLELPSSVFMYEQVHPLIDAAKKCLLANYKDFNKYQEEALALPLSAIEVLFGSDGLQADLSEDDVFEFILKWGRAQYPALYRLCEILTKCLAQFIRFRGMSSSKLKDVLVCPDLDREEVSKLMLEAFIRTVEVPYVQHIRASNKYQVIKVEKSEPPQPRCVVYFDLKKEDCENLFPSGRLNSQSFHLGGRVFYISARCEEEESQHSFGLFLTASKISKCCPLDFQFAAMKKSSMKFQIKGTGKEVKFSNLGLNSWGFPDLFKIPWSDLMSKEG